MPGNRQAVTDGDVAGGQSARLLLPSAAPPRRGLMPVPAPPAVQPATPNRVAPLVPSEPGQATGRRLLAGRHRGKALRLISPLAVLVSWQLTSALGLVSAKKLPPPTQIWSTIVTLVTTDQTAYGTLQGALAVSLERVVVGFAFGATIGLLLAFTAGLSRFGENAVDPLMQMLRTLPLFGLIPVFILWFGIGEAPKIILIAIGAAIPLYLNAFAGIRNVDPRLGELARVLQLSRRELVTQIVLPGAMPQILVGAPESRRRVAGARCGRAGQRQRGARLHDQPGHPVPPKRRDHRGAARLLRPRADHRLACPHAGKEGTSVASQLRGA